MDAVAFYQFREHPASAVVLIACWRVIMRDPELEKAIAEFIGAFELVFHKDWDWSKGMMVHNMDKIIPPAGTFLRPSLDPQHANWGARAALLQAHQRLMTVLKARGVEPAVPVPDPWFVFSWPT